MGNGRGDREWFAPDEEPEDEVFQDRIDRFEEYSRDEEQYHKIFSELGFVFVEDGCDGYCPKCENRRTCPNYPELRVGWESLKPRPGSGDSSVGRMPEGRSAAHGSTRVVKPPAGPSTRASFTEWRNLLRSSALRGLAAAAA